MTQYAVNLVQRRLIGEGFIIFIPWSVRGAGAGVRRVRIVSRGHMIADLLAPLAEYLCCGCNNSIALS